MSHKTKPDQTTYRPSINQILNDRMRETEYGGEVTLAEATDGDSKIGLSATRSEWEQIVREQDALDMVAEEASKIKIIAGSSANGRISYSDWVFLSDALDNLAAVRKGGSK